MSGSNFNSDYIISPPVFFTKPVESIRDEEDPRDSRSKKRRQDPEDQQSSKKVAELVLQKEILILLQQLLKEGEGKASSHTFSNNSPAGIALNILGKQEVSESS